MTNRRDLLLAASATALGASMFSARSTEAAPRQSDDSTQGTPSMPVRFALNTSTIRGQQLSLVEQFQVAAKAGYDGIEPWIRDIESYVKEGGNPTDIKKLAEDSGLTVDSAIGFAHWISEDDEQRANGLEQAKKDMDLVAEIGGTRIAAPPIGAHRGDSVPPALPAIAQRYRALLEVGDKAGVGAQLELWGFSPTLSKLAELAYVATGAQHPGACVLPDFYHIYKGGNDFAGLAMIEASRMHCFHINDYPDDPPRNEIGDKHRVFPGDGVCELPLIIRGLIDRGFTGVFSLELFNPEYWERDAMAVVSEGLEKSKAVVQAAMEL